MAETPALAQDEQELFPPKKHDSFTYNYDFEVAAYEAGKGKRSVNPVLAGQDIGGAMKLFFDAVETETTATSKDKKFAYALLGGLSLWQLVSVGSVIAIDVVLSAYGAQTFSSKLASLNFLPQQISWLPQVATGAMSFVIAGMFFVGNRFIKMSPASSRFLKFAGVALLATMAVAVGMQATHDFAPDVSATHAQNTALSDALAKQADDQRSFDAALANGNTAKEERYADMLRHDGDAVRTAQHTIGAATSHSLGQWIFFPLSALYFSVSTVFAYLVSEGGWREGERRLNKAGNRRALEAKKDNMVLTEDGAKQKAIEFLSKYKRAYQAGVNQTWSFSKSGEITDKAFNAIEVDIVDVATYSFGTSMSKKVKWTPSRPEILDQAKGKTTGNDAKAA